MNSLMLLAVDPNVCIAAGIGDDASELLLERIQSYQADGYIRVALDTDDQIWTEYERILPQVGDSVQKWLTWLISNRTACTSEVDVTDEISDSRYMATLVSLGCDQPIEPHLIAIANSPNHQTALILAKSSKGTNHVNWRNRGSHMDSVRHSLAEHWPGIETRIIFSTTAPRHLVEWVERNPPFPHTLHDLQVLLGMHHFKETDTLEFKQPNTEHITDADGASGTHLGQGNVFRSACESICAMANRYGGRVIIGIEEDETTKEGKVVGFVPMYRTKFYSDDELERMFQDRCLGGFSPQHPALRLHTIRLPDKKRVLVIHVGKSTRVLSYNGKEYVRVGTEDRTGFQSFTI